MRESNADLASDLDAMTKARLVFWRWQHPPPGSRAFVHAKADTRINVPALRQAMELSQG
jgi:hypothetical protein